MQMLAKNRTFSVLTSFGYVLTITVAALFHNHGGNEGGCFGCHSGASTKSLACDCDAHGEDRSCPAAPVDGSTDCGGCLICQFLAQKPVPVEDVPPPTFESMVEEAVAPAPARVAGVVFSAWRSRAPPSVA